ncbi:MAG TPA: thioredoxin family protein [Burkholderiaceae bacterium]|jgi:thioredoxin 1|nr:thioredoxin family protein [Burkholderiaceae bacterium]
MNFFDAHTRLPELARRLETHEGLVVACYCAAWCDTCNAYRPGFEALAGRLPQHLFVWVDIEECEALLDDIDVENFPTILVQSPQGNLFFGPLLPHLEHLERLLQGLDASCPADHPGPGPLKDLID